ncbi:PEGA domain-containing protein [Candidatus Uhrbacteria bacterium]|nr:PEGA domain-containing protein [Candidatus Uhrbacteria bacterium]
MEKHARSILFWSFFFVFLLIAPLVILYTSGYRYNPATKRLAQTGGISVTSIPRGAALTLNGKRTKYLSPALLRFVPPGAATLRISKEEFLPLDMRFPVVRRQTALLEDIVLWRRSVPTPLEQDPTLLTPNHRGTTYALAVTSGNWTEVWMVDFRDPKKRLLITRLPSLATGRLIIEWSPDDEWILLVPKDRPADSLFVRFDGTQPARTAETISKALTSPLSSITWIEGDPHRLLATTKNGSLLWEPGRAAENIPVEAVLAKRGERIYTLATDKNRTVVMEGYGLEGMPLASLPPSSYRFAESPETYLTLSDKTSLVVLSLASKENSLVLKTDATMFAWSPDKKSIAYSNGYTTALLHLPSGKTTILSHTSDPSTALAWHPKGTALVIAEAKELVAYDLSVGRAVTPLTAARGVSTIIFEKDGEAFWFLGNVNEANGLYQIRVR